MADANFSIGQVGITGYLVINARKTTDPNVVAYTQTIAPPIGTTRNISFNNIEPGIYEFDFRDSTDGISLGNLLATYVVDAETQQIVAEKRFYTVGGLGAHDPAINSDILTDPFLDGKVTAFYKADRYMIKDVEYTNVAGGGIQLLSGLIFSEGEVVMVEVNYTVVQQSNAVQGIFAGAATIATNVILNNTFYNKIIACESPSSRLVITLPDITTIPDGKFFYFTFQSGTQYQTRFLAQGTNVILFAGAQLSEISIGRGEILWIEKRGGSFRVISDAPGCLAVGTNLSANDINHPNTLPCNGVLLDGDDYPRIWHWIDKVLGTLNQIIDDGVNNVNYVHPVGKETMWARTVTGKKFRTPNKQGWSERGLDNFVSPGGSPDMVYDHPGGTQLGRVGVHFHDVGTETDTSSKYRRSTTVHESRHWIANNNNAQLPTSTDLNKKTDGNYADKNLVDSSRVIYLVRI